MYLMKYFNFSFKVSDFPPPGYVPPPGVHLAQPNPPRHERVALYNTPDGRPPGRRNKHQHTVTATAPPAEAPRLLPATASAPPPGYTEALLMDKV